MSAIQVEKSHLSSPSSYDSSSSRSQPSTTARTKGDKSCKLKGAHPTPSTLGLSHRSTTVTSEAVTEIADLRSSCSTFEGFTEQQLNSLLVLHGNYSADDQLLEATQRELRASAQHQPSQSVGLLKPKLQANEAATKALQSSRSGGGSARSKLTSGSGGSFGDATPAKCLEGELCGQFSDAATEAEGEALSTIVTKRSSLGSSDFDGSHELRAAHLQLSDKSRPHQMPPNHRRHSQYSMLGFRLQGNKRQEMPLTGIVRRRCNPIRVCCRHVRFQPELTNATLAYSLDSDTSSCRKRSSKVKRASPLRSSTIAALKTNPHRSSNRSEEGFQYSKRHSIVRVEERFFPTEKEASNIFIAMRLLGCC